MGIGPIAPEDWDAGFEAVRRARDQALHDLEEQRKVAREVVAMDRLHFADTLSLSRHAKWMDLLEMAKQSLK